jgi:bacterioferritin (cytochrome b1)
MAKSRTSKKVIQEKLVATMQAWQKVEDASVASTGRVIDKTSNPIVRLVMEIIQRDSQMHHRVQGLIVDSLSKMVSLTPEEIGEVWGMIEKHIKLEKQTIELAESALETIGGSKGMLVQSYLIEYLLDDEKKHDQLLERLRHIQKGMYPYG